MNIISTEYGTATFIESVWVPFRFDYVEPDDWSGHLDAPEIIPAGACYSKWNPLHMAPTRHQCLTCRAKHSY